MSKLTGKVIYTQKDGRYWLVLRVDEELELFWVRELDRSFRTYIGFEAIR